MARNPVRIPASANPRQILDALNRWSLKTEPRYSRNLWFILTALRGPDVDGHTGTKMTLTVPVRWPLRDLAGAAAAHTPREQPDLIKVWSKIPEVVHSLYHYTNHIECACDALRIWYPECFGLCDNS